MAKLGGYQFEKFEKFDKAKLKQRPASAWSVVEGLTGATFELIMYCGVQVVRGLNHCFIAEETLQTIDQRKRLVTVVVNEFNGKFELVRDRFAVIYG